MRSSSVSIGLPTSSRNDATRSGVTGGEALPKLLRT